MNIYITSSLRTWHNVNQMYFLFFLGPHLNLQHMEVPRLRVKYELQLLAYTTAAAMLDLSPICDLCCSCGNAGS